MGQLLAKPSDTVPIYLDCRSPLLVCRRRRDISNDDIRATLTANYHIPQHMRDARMKVSRYCAGILVRFDDEPAIYVYSRWYIRYTAHQPPASFPVTDFENDMFENDHRIW